MLLLHRLISDIAQLVLLFRKKLNILIKNNRLSSQERFKTYLDERLTQIQALDSEILFWIVNSRGISMISFTWAMWPSAFVCIQPITLQTSQYFELKFPTTSIRSCRKEPCGEAYSVLGFNTHIPFYLLTYFVTKHVLHKYSIFIYSDLLNYFSNQLVIIIELICTFSEHIHEKGPI